MASSTEAPSTESSAKQSSAVPSDALSKLRIRRETAPAPRSAMGKIVRAGILLLLLAGLGLGGFLAASKAGWVSGNQNWISMPDAIMPRTEVRLSKVTVESGRSADALVVATGYLESRRQAKIGARAPGRIEILNVEEGSRVKAGEVLAVLEHADLDASLAAVRSSLDRNRAALNEQEIVISQNKRDLDRAERLHKSNTVGDAELEDKRFKYESAVARRALLQADIGLAEARVREADQMKENMFIRAPFDGTVISKDAELGESILPGGMGEASGRGSAVTVADLDHLEVEADVKEDFIGRVSTGQATEVAVDAVPKVRYRGVVRKIIPMGDRARATIKVKVEIVDADARLFPNMSATVYFLPPESESKSDTAAKRVFCESDAIIADNTGHFVWIADEQDRTKRVNVTIGDERDKKTEILDGLVGGERVVIAPPGIQSGQLVKVGR